MAFGWIVEDLSPWIQKLCVARTSPIALGLNCLLQGTNGVIWPDRDCELALP